MSVAVINFYSLFSNLYFFTLLLLFLILSLTTSLSHSTSPPPFNISHFLYPTSNDVAVAVAVDVDHHHPDHSPFLKGVLEEIASGEKWNLEDIRVSKLDVKKAKFGYLQKFEFRARFGKSEFVFKLLDQVSGWKRFQKLENESDFQYLVNEFSSKANAAVLDSFKIEGPFHLRVAGDHLLNLLLPLNNSFPGLKHILVGEGITVEVTGAKEASLFHSTDIRKTVNGSALSSLERNNFGYWPSSCMAWFPIRVFGSATVVAYRTRNPEGHIETIFSSDHTVKLLPEKCYDSRRVYQKWDRALPINFLSKRIALLDKVLQTFLGRKTNQTASSATVKVKITASSIFRFQLELERDIHSNDTYWSTLAEWRTKPIVERVWFEVVGRLEEEDLKPITIKKIRPFIEVDSKAWSNLMSNVSFTKFPSIVGPQEALTLDVKW
ncbi:hypothetical protein ACH5RR_035065 [Cinchona calisaya]|uniref:Uncharacterized protein n=1 Tax=Cinchona calisaya TaxID=153742 RepID=A0ABD2YGP8_9GENT